jgi:multidrug efflux pump subunit AcrB
MKVQNFPDIDLPTVTVTAALPGASPAQLETEVARKIENSIATCRASSTSTPSCRTARPPSRLEFRLEKPTQEAVDDVRDAVSRVRSDLPADLRDPVISQDQPVGLADPDLHRGLARMDDEALSWFVDNQSPRPAERARRRLGQPRGRRHARGARRARPGALLALNATAADISRQLRQVQQDASGGRTDVGGAEQSVRTMATVQSAEELARWRSRCPTAGASASTRWPGERHRGRAARSAALLDGKPVVGFEIVRSLGAGEVDVPRACAPRSTELRKARTRTSPSPRPSTSSTRCRRTTTAR